MLRLNARFYFGFLMARFRNLSLCFDLDGTLIDTAPDLVRVLNAVIAEEGLPETEFDAGAQGCRLWLAGAD